MIRRKDSFGYIDFIRGKYSPYNMSQLQKMFDEMSIEEKMRICKYNFHQLWCMMWGDNEGMIIDNGTCIKMKDKQHKMEEYSSSKKFHTLLSGVMIDDKKITINSLIQHSNTKWEETEWEFPKGRRNYTKESDLDCALREFEEETGISKKKIHIIENIMPYEETFIGTNHKAYKHKYFIGYIEPESLVLDKYQKNEVSKLDCKTLEECLISIRPYNYEKKSIIQKIHESITENCFFHDYFIYE
jgi:ADP-ribose pyrophosphatase YjhB (NUDIX family)